MKGALSVPGGPRPGVGRVPGMANDRATQGDRLLRGYDSPVISHIKGLEKSMARVSYFPC